MPQIDCFVIKEKTALLQLDGIFPECETFSSKRTPRLVCLPEPKSCSACQSLPSLIQRLAKLFQASDWELIIMYWKEGESIKGLASFAKDPAEVRLFTINRSGFALVKSHSEEFAIDMPLFS